MKARLLPDWALNYTLPDEYFEQRLSLTAAEIEEIQDEALPKAYAYAFENSAMYNKKFKAYGLTIDSIKGRADLAKLPLTTVEDIRPNPAKGLTIEQVVAVDQREVSLAHRSSGTTGYPKIFPYTGKDIALYAANVALTFWINGLRKEDVLLALVPFGEFTGGGGSYLGGMALGVTTLPVSIGPGLSDKLMAHLTGRLKMNGYEVLLDPWIRVTAIVCLSSFLPRLEEMLDQYGVEPKDLSLKKVINGAEPTSDVLRERFARRFGFMPRDIYGLGEFYGPGVASECSSGGGLHILSDCYMTEVINPETGLPTPEGEMGELVLTSLFKEAMPIFRYRTGDRLVNLPQNCPCGIKHQWVGRIPGRINADDIIIPGGIQVNRTYLENILLSANGTGSEYVVTVDEHPTRKGLTRMYIAIEGDENSNLAEVISHRIRVEYNHSPAVIVLPLGAIERKSGKAKRILPPEEFRALVGQRVVEVER